MIFLDKINNKNKKKGDKFLRSISLGIKDSTNYCDFLKDYFTEIYLKRQYTNNIINKWILN